MFNKHSLIHFFIWHFAVFQYLCLIFSVMQSKWNERSALVYFFRPGCVPKSIPRYWSSTRSTFFRSFPEVPACSSSWSMPATRRGTVVLTFRSQVKSRRFDRTREMIMVAIERRKTDNDNWERQLEMINYVAIWDSHPKSIPSFLVWHI